MDPISRAAQHLLRDLARGFNKKSSALRLRAAPGDRATLIKSLRLAEWQPDSRHPLCLVEAPFTADYPRELQTRMRADFTALQRGLADDNITLADPDAPTPAARPASTPHASPSSSAHPAARPPSSAHPAARPPSPAATACRDLAARLAAHLAATTVVDGWCIALVPSAPPSDPAWPTFLADLLATPAPGLRWLIWDPDPEPLAQILPPHATLEIDDAATWKYLDAQLHRPSAPPDEPREALVAALTAARAADPRAALAAYARAAAAFERASAPAQAATVRVAMGGLSMGTGDLPGAVAHFDRAAAQAGRAGAWTVACQAELGGAGVHRLRRQLAAAERRYAAAADTAKRAELPALRIEALRMAGTCALERGEPQVATGLWRAAVDAGSELPPPERAATTLTQTGEQLIALLNQRGLTTQAAAVRAQLGEV